MILKDRRRLDRFAQLTERKVELASRLLTIARDRLSRRAAAVKPPFSTTLTRS